MLVDVGGSVRTKPGDSSAANQGLGFDHYQGYLEADADVGGLFAELHQPKQNSKP